MPSFQPKTESEVSNVLSPGEYDAEVESADEKMSRNGNEMIELSVRVFRPDSGKVLLRDWLLFGDEMAFKLRHFCRAAGILDQYHSGSIEAYHCEGKAVKVRVTVQDDPKYGEQNRIADYVGGNELDEKPAPAGVSGQQTKAANKAAAEDDIPF